MIRTRIVGLAVAGLAALVTTGAAAWQSAGQTPQATSGPQLSWITLGTQGGPSPSADRSEPANLLLVDGQPWIVDCGDGAMDRLAAAGFQPDQVHTAFISHLHPDHIGGLLGLIALHWIDGG